MQSIEVKVIHDKKFNGVYIDLSIDEFNKNGFTLGDSLDLYFSNNEVLIDVPYYDGYYPSHNNYVLCAYSSYPAPCLSFEGSGAWFKLNLKENDTVKIVLNSIGKYKFIQETFKQNHPSNRDYYISDEAFSNFRVLKADNLKENFIFRGGSPVCNDFGFVSTVNDLLEKHNINYVLNLSDTKTEFEKMVENCKEYYIYNLYKENKISELDLSAFPNELSYAQKIVNGLNETVKNDGPVYIHCMEGKDRTGFLCILILALTKGNILDFEEDYMKTYENFYYIDKESSSEKYNLIKDHYFTKRLMNQLCNSENKEDFSDVDFFQKAIEYLKFGGMNDTQIKELLNFLSK